MTISDILRFVPLALAALFLWSLLTASPALAFAPDQPLTPIPSPPADPDTPLSFWSSPSNLLPDLRTLPPSDLEIKRLYNGERQLRLSNTIWNSGPGPLELSGETNPVTRRTTVHQRIHTVSGDTYMHPVGEFVWHPTHDHWHFEDFTIYELWSIHPTGDRLELLASSDKLSYCVIDTDIVDPENAGFSPNRRYGGCGQKLQGLSPGWGDTYKYHLDGQSIEISFLRDGIYMLRSVTDPTGMIIESVPANNSAEQYIKILGNHVEVVTSNELSEFFCLSMGRC